MNTLNVSNTLIEAGCVVWEKGYLKRIYFNRNAHVSALGAKIVDRVMYSGQIRTINQATKSYYDVNEDLFYCDSSELKDLMLQLGFKAVRIPAKKFY